MNEWDILEQKVNELVEEIKQLKIKQKEESVKRWRGNEGNSYWYVDDVEGVARSYEDSHEADDLRYCTGNYFETEHECEQYLKNLITKQKLKDLALELNNGKEIDWSNINQSKYNIIYDADVQNLKLTHSYSYQAPGQVYCVNAEFLDYAIAKIGNKELINLIKSGV